MKIKLLSYLKRFSLTIYGLLPIAFFLLLLYGCSSTNLSQEDTQKIINQVKNSKLIILDVYHDRCESCKYIEPVIEKLQSENSMNSDLAFLKYDLSNPFTIYRSRKIAKLLGLENIYKLQRYSGVVLIVDSKRKLVLDTLISEYNIDKYNEVIKERLRAT